jgi:hypothetical protein
MPILDFGGVKLVVRIFPSIETFEMTVCPLTFIVNSMRGATASHSK